MLPPPPHPRFLRGSTLLTWRRGFLSPNSAVSWSRLPPLSFIFRFDLWGGPESPPFSFRDPLSDSTPLHLPHRSFLPAAAKPRQNREVVLPGRPLPRCAMIQTLSLFGPQLEIHFIGYWLWFSLDSQIYFPSLSLRVFHQI